MSGPRRNTGDHGGLAVTDQSPAEMMAHFDALPPALRAVYRDCPLCMRVRSPDWHRAFGRPPEVLAAALAAGFDHMTRLSCRELYGPDHPSLAEPGP